MNTATRLGLLTFVALVPVIACAHPAVRPLVRLPYGLQVEVLDDGGEALPTADWGGRRYLLGEHGDRYVIRVTNPSARRVEVVVSVDGLDVIDGKPASFGKRGYVVNPYGEVRIEGWRTSVHGVAAFRFGRVADSYAARTVGARNVGVIGAALFTEREPPRAVLPVPRRGYHLDEEPSGRGRGGAGAPPPAKPAPAPAAPPRSAAKSAPRAGAAESDGALARRRPAEERPGLGTEYGEHRTSSVSYTSFVRESPARPAAYTEMRYNDQSGLARLGIHFAPPCCDEGDDALLRETARPFPGNRAFAAPPPGRQH